MRAILIFTLFLAMSSFSAQANFTNASDLLNKCTVSKAPSEIKQFQEIHCLGYLSGLVDGVQLIFGVKPQSKFFCPPSQGVSSEQLLHIVRHWVKNNPKSAKDSARMTTLIAYAKSFPCS